MVKVYPGGSKWFNESTGKYKPGTPKHILDGQRELERLKPVPKKPAPIVGKPVPKKPAPIPRKPAPKGPAPIIGRPVPRKPDVPTPRVPVKPAPKKPGKPGMVYKGF
jgi:hypothetical protein